MPTLLILCCLWGIAATVVALLPMRFQMVPGILLLAAAPVLLYFLTKQHGFAVFLLALAAVLSMFRRPLFYLLRRLFGRFLKRSE